VSSSEVVVASIDVRRAGQKRFRARWTEPDGREHARHFETRSETENFLVHLNQHAGDRSVIHQPSRSSTLDAYIAQWLSLQVHRATTSERARYVIDARVRPRFGRQKLTTITRPEVARWVNDLRRKNLKASTIRTYLWYLSAIMDQARQEGIVTDNPCLGIKTPRDHGIHRVVLPLSVAEVNLIADNIGERYRAIVLLMTHGGLRLGEASGLCESRVDLERGEVVVDRQIVSLAFCQPVFGPPKTPSSVRRLALSRPFEKALRHHMAKSARGPDGMIFTTPHGNPIARTTFGALFRRVTGRLGISATSHEARPRRV
jgi:integrase